MSALMRVRRSALLGAASLLLAALVAWPGAARANGRFPLASQLVVDPTDARHLVVRTTYGLVQTFDDGASWRWVCERSPGYGGTFDPAIAVTGTGRGLVGLFDGLASTIDRGCTYARAGEPLLGGQFVIDLVVRATAPSEALALTSTGTSAGFHVIVAASGDGGATWAQLGAALPLDFNSETLEIAPSRPERLYASGLTGPPRQGVLFRSDDRGGTWERVAFDLRGGLAPYLAAVDPRDPDRVYLRLDGDAPAGQSDTLWVSRDGARTWTLLGRTEGEMLGFALSPDGARLAFGGPTDGVWTLDPRAAAPTPVRASSVHVRCLAWSAEGLYACGEEALDGFTVGLSRDEGRTFAARHHLSQLSPLACGAGTTTGAQCLGDWERVAPTIGAEDAGTDAGADGGRAPSGSGSGGGGGCGCRAPSGGTPQGSALCVLALGLLAFARRKW